MDKELHDFMEQLAKQGEDGVISQLTKDAVTALTLGIGGALTPAAARQYFTTVTDQSSFLGRVTSVQVDAIEQDVDLFHVADRQLQRVAEGTEPSTFTGASNLGKRWYLKDVQLYPTINFSTLVQRQKFGDIESYLADKFATVFRNDLLILGLVGDEASQDTFVNLNDGWIAKATDAVDGTARELTASRSQRLSHGTVTGTYVVGETITGDESSATAEISVIGSGYLDVVNVVGTFEVGEALVGGTSAATSDVTLLGAIDFAWMLSMDSCLHAMADKYLNEAKTSFIMSKQAALKWGKEMAIHDGLNPYLISGNVPRYQGYEVIGVAGFPQSTILFTDPANLGFGMGSQINRYREIRPRKRCIEYTWHLYSDYLIFNDEAVVLSV